MGSCACNTGGGFKGLEVRRCCSLPQSAKPSTVASFWPVACNRVGLIQSPQTSLHSRLLKQAATFSRHYVTGNVSTLAPGHLRQCERKSSQLCWSSYHLVVAYPALRDPPLKTHDGEIQRVDGFLSIFETCCRSWAKSAKSTQQDDPSRISRPFRRTIYAIWTKNLGIFWDWGYHGYHGYVMRKHVLGKLDL